MLAISSKLCLLDQLTSIMQIFGIVITTFIFCGLGNLSQESPTHVNIIRTHQQDRLYPLITNESGFNECNLSIENHARKPLITTKCAIFST